MGSDNTPLVICSAGVLFATPVGNVWEHVKGQNEQKYFDFMVDRKRELWACGLDFALEFLLLAKGYGSTIDQEKAAA